MLTREQFIATYARNSSMSVATLKALGFEATECSCGEGNCRGWQMTMTKLKKVGAP